MTRAQIWTKRTDAVIVLCRQWLTLHRPDVLKAILKEVDKAYPLPLKRLRAPKMKMPTSLRNLK